MGYKAKYDIENGLVISHDMELEHFVPSPYDIIAEQSEQIALLKKRILELAKNEARLIALVDDLLAERERVA